MSIKVMSKWQYKNRPYKYQYALYGGIQNSQKELENLELFCYFKDKKSLKKNKDYMINQGYKNQDRYKSYKFKIISV